MICVQFFNPNSDKQTEEMIIKFLAQIAINRMQKEGYKRTSGS